MDDSKTKFVFSDDCSLLPSDRPQDFPHIVDIDEYEGKTLNFADAIATYLWNYDKDPYHQFFDLTKNHFLLTHYAPGDPVIERMRISRYDRTVTAGVLSVWPGQQDLHWNEKLEYIIEEDGSWKPKWCKTVWGTAFVAEKIVEEMGRQFAGRVLLYQKFSKTGSAYT